jgi:aspartyl-tRNA(Asn)/glutamyl-tRNA(Gln) amidotransferase subunit B
VEVVTEPDIRTPEQAKLFLQLLKNTIETLGVSDCNMEEGSLRCDANISVRPRGWSELGTKTELKNMNSFRFIERGIHAELARQIDLIERGEQVEQATMHYDPNTGAIRQLRSKEAAHDYRYFPEPDLVPIEVTSEHVERVRMDMTELPMARMERFSEQYGLSAYDADVLNQSRETADFYEAAVAAAKTADAKLVANWTMGELLALQKDDKDVEPAQLAALVDLVAAKTISGAVAKELLVRIADEGIDPAATVEAEGLAQVSDTGALREVIIGILDANPAQVEQYKGGKETLVGFFVGQVMKAMQGKADPAATKDLIVELLAER